MIEVEVNINNFKDKENKKQKLQIIREGKVLVLNEGDLLQKGDKYKISKDRYKELSKLGIVVRSQKNIEKNMEGYLWQRVRLRNG